MLDWCSKTQNVPSTGSWSTRSSGLAICLVCLAPAPHVADAATLRDALATAHTSNPTIEAQRAQLRATDEDINRARSGYKPQIFGTLHAGYQETHVRPSNGNGGSGPYGFDISLSQPIFTGFQTVNRIRGAEASVRAGRALLSSVEQQIFLEVVRAYADVVRDGLIVQLRERNLNLLNRQLAGTRERLAVNEVTQTDMSQVLARRSSAVAQLALARANLQSSRSTYKEVVGVSPLSLASIRQARKGLPRSRHQAAQIALRQHPNIVRAIFLEAAARYTVDTIRGEFLPSARLDLQHSRSLETTHTTSRSENTQVRAEVTVPLYQGGEVSARVRQAKHLLFSRSKEVERERKAAKARAETAFAQMRAAQRAVQAGTSATEANKRALNGVREEEAVGQRTVLDVLNAQLELLNSQIQLTIDQRNAIVASYTLLAAVGRFDGDALHFNGNYDPKENLERIKVGRWKTSVVPRKWRAPVSSNHVPDRWGKYEIRTHRH